MNTSEKIETISGALVEANKELGNIDQDAINPFYKSRYATLAHVLDIVRPILTKNGLAILQGADMDEQKNVVVKTRIFHSSGEWIETNIKVPAQNGGRFDAQTVGAAITYGRRYALSAILNIASEEDTDGNELVTSKKNINNINFEEIKQKLNEIKDKEEGKEYYLTITGQGVSAKQLAEINKMFENWRKENNI